jgi:hypothetical protein
MTVFLMPGAAENTQELSDKAARAEAVIAEGFRQLRNPLFQKLVRASLRSQYEDDLQKLFIDLDAYNREVTKVQGASRSPGGIVAAGTAITAGETVTAGGARIPAPPVVAIGIIIGLCARALADRITVATSREAATATQLEISLQQVRTTAQTISQTLLPPPPSSPLPLPFTPDLPPQGLELLRRLGVLGGVASALFIVQSKILQAVEAISEWAANLTAAQKRHCSDQYLKLLRIMAEITTKMATGSASAEEVLRLVTDLLDALEALCRCLGVPNPFGGPGAN